MKSIDHLHIVEQSFAEKPEQPEPPQAQTPARPYAELRASSAFSFLDSATLPEDLIATAAQRDVPAMALIDRNGVYGAPRFYTAAKKCGVRALVGSELGGVTVLEGNRTGYKNLCKLVTAGAAGRPKGEAQFTLELIEQYAEGLHCLTRDDEKTIDKLIGIFNGRVHGELQRHFVREEEHHNYRLIDIARKKRLKLIATNGVRYAHPQEK